jgi:hypothetical protein
MRSILHHFEDARPTSKASEWLGIEMLVAALGKVQGVPHHLAHLCGKTTQVIMR